ncbi:MAG: YesL family protein [Clostridia bacterium]|nr:YesL family protein [Clostridia bacterium]
MSKGKDQGEKKKFNLFNFFARKSDPAGVDPNEPLITDNPNFVNFFKLFVRKFSNITLINIMIVLTNFPMFFFLIGISGFFSGHTTAPAYNLYPHLSGIVSEKLSPASAALFGTYSLQTNVTVLSPTDYVFFWLTLLLVFTIGISSVGSVYLHRNMVRGEPVFLLSDYVGTVKRNLKQTLIFGFIDSLIIGILVYDVAFLRVNSMSGMTTGIMFAAVIFLIVLYFLIRTYIYTMIVTFDMPIIKMFKNALIMSVVGFKRNIFYLLGSAVVIVLNYLLLMLYFPIGIILPFMIVPSALTFLGEYCVFPNIMKYMVKDD